MARETMLSVMSLRRRANRPRCPPTLTPRANSSTGPPARNAGRRSMAQPALLHARTRAASLTGRKDLLAASCPCPPGTGKASWRGWKSHTNVSVPAVSPAAAAEPASPHPPPAPTRREPRPDELHVVSHPTETCHRVCVTGRYLAWTETLVLDIVWAIFKNNL